MPLQTSRSLPVIKGSEQPLTNDFLGPNPTLMSSAATNNYAIDARGNSRVIAGPVSTTFTGPIASVHAHYATSVDAHKKIIDWLDPKQLKAKHSRFHEIVRKSFMEGTGLWFLDSEAFKAWKDEGGSPIWIHGLVGCGKTVLCSSIIEDIRKSCAPMPTQLYYFYCSFLDSDRQDLDAILRLLLVSLCTVDATPSKVQALYEECKQSYPVEVPSTERLKQIVLAILRDVIEDASPLIPGDKAEFTVRKHIYFVIDALDEIPLSYSEDVLNFLQELARESLPWLHLLVTSRFDSRIETILGDPSLWNIIPIAKEAVNDDIERYVSKIVHDDKRLSKLCSESITVKDLMEERLVKRGNGMFKWTALQLSMLKRLRVVNFLTVEHELLRLPDDLNATYARILSQLDDVLADHAVIALQWLTTSARYLFVEELAEACAIKVGRTPLLDDPQRRLDEEDILEMLHDLVIVENFSASTTAPHKRRKILLAHFSVQEFLADREILIGTSKKLRITPKQSHLLLAKSCFSYLYYIQAEDKSGYPLKEYAWYNWEHHICPQSAIKKERVRRKAAQLYKLLTTRVPALLDSSHTFGSISNDPISPEQELALALDWMPRDGLESLEVLRKTLGVIGGRPEATVRNCRDIMPHYYLPLPTSSGFIRLMTLVPCLDDARETEGYLYSVRLEDKPVYDALSYTWGDSFEHEKILVDGRQQKVSRNLGAILQGLRLRPEDESQLLWVDAICINQLDNMEKTHQVLQMPQIYRQAKEVVIGFGKGKMEDEKAINYLIKLAESLREREIGIPGASSSVQTLLNQIETDSDGWSSILDLFDRAWWQRAWVTQEIVVAADATLLYGMLSLKFTVLEHIMRYMNILEILIKQATGTSTSFLRLVTHRGWLAAYEMWLTRQEYLLNHPMGLPQLLWRFKDRTCTDSRDKVYSILGLVNPLHHGVISPDYSKSTDEIVTEVTAHIISTYKCLDTFSVRPVYRSCPVTRSLPSWVTDFSCLGLSYDQSARATPLSLGIFEGRASMSLFSAGGLDSSPIFTLSASYDIFTIVGVTTDLINRCYSYGEETLSDRTSLERLLRKHPLKRVLETILGMDAGLLWQATNNEQTRMKAFWRTILAGQWNEGESLFQSRLPNHFRIPPSTQAEHEALCNFEGLWQYLRYICGRRLILTQNLRLALVPRIATEGDIIVVMPGGAVPYVLRPLEKDWLFIGECYVDGIMHGEEMQGDVQMQNFTLV